MSSISCCILIPAEDMDQSQGKYYGRIVTKDRRMLRFFVQVDGKNLWEVYQQQVTEPFISCQESRYLVSWQDLTCHGTRLFLSTVVKGPVDVNYVCVVLGLQEVSSLPVLQGRANKRRFGHVARLSVNSGRAWVVSSARVIDQGTGSVAVA